MFHHRIVLIAVLIVSAPASTRANEPNANFVLRLFIDACIPNMGHPEKVRAWAAEQHLPEVTAPPALELFVGAGTKGAAWAVPSSLGSFALSIRGTTEACAVWARTADPVEVAAGFQKIMDGVTRPGLDVGIESDTTTATHVGQARSLAYHVWPSTGQTGFVFTMLTAEHPGGGFQASIQVARATRP
jgi:hypothetical protein